MSNNTEESQDGMYKIPEEIGAEKMLVFQPDFLQAIGVTVPLNSLQNYLESSTVDEKSTGKIDRKVKFKCRQNAAKKTRGKKCSSINNKMVKTVNKYPSNGSDSEEKSEHFENITHVDENLHDSKLKREHLNSVRSDVAIHEVNPIFEEQNESSISQTCNLLKESVLLSPSFTNHVTLNVKDNENQLEAHISDLSNLQENKTNGKSEMIMNENEYPHQMHIATHVESKIANKNVLSDSELLEDGLHESSAFIRSIRNVHAVSEKKQHSTILEEALTGTRSKSNEYSKTFLPRYMPIEDSIQNIQNNCKKDINKVNKETQSFINKYIGKINCSDNSNATCRVPEKHSESVNEVTTEKEILLQNGTDGASEMPLPTIKLHCSTENNENKVSILSEEVIKAVKVNSKKRQKLIASVENNQVHELNRLENYNCNGNVLPEKNTQHLFVDQICIGCTDIECSNVMKCSLHKSTMLTKIDPKQYFIKSKNLLNEDNDKHDAVHSPLFAVIPENFDESILQQNEGRFPSQNDNSEPFALCPNNLLFKPVTTDQPTNDELSVAISQTKNMNLQLQVECNQIFHDEKSVSVLLEQKEELKVSNLNNEGFLSKQCETGLAYHKNESLSKKIMLIKNMDQLYHHDTEEMQKYSNTAETMILTKNKDQFCHLDNAKELKSQLNYNHNIEEENIAPQYNVPIDIAELLDNPVSEHVEYLNKETIVNLNQSEADSGNELLILDKSHIQFQSDFKTTLTKTENAAKKSMIDYPKVPSNAEITKSPFNVYYGFINRLNGNKSQNVNITDDHSKSVSLQISVNKKNIRNIGDVTNLNVEKKDNTVSPEHNSVRNIDFIIAPDEVNATVIAKCLKKAIDRRSQSLNSYHNKNHPPFQRFRNSSADNKIDKSIEFSWPKSCVNLKTYSRKNNIVPDIKNVSKFRHKTDTSANNASCKILPIDCDIESDTHTIDFPLNGYSQLRHSIEIDNVDNDVMKLLHVTNGLMNLTSEHNMIEFMDEMGETKEEDLRCTSMFFTPEEGQSEEFNNITDAILTEKENVELFQNILPKENTQLLYSNFMFEDNSPDEDKCNSEDDDLLNINTGDSLDLSLLFSDDYGDNSLSNCNFDNNDSTLGNIISDNDIFMDTCLLSANDIRTSAKISLLSKNQFSPNLLSPDIKCKLVKTELNFDDHNICGDIDKVCKEINKNIEINSKNEIKDMETKSNAFDKKNKITNNLNVDISMKTSEDKHVLSNSCGGMSTCDDIKVNQKICDDIGKVCKETNKDIKNNSIINTSTQCTLHKNFENTKNKTIDISMDTSEDKNLLSNSSIEMSTCDDVKVDHTICGDIENAEINKVIENDSNMSTKSNTLNKDFCQNIDINMQTSDNKKLLRNSHAEMSICDDINLTRHAKDALEDNIYCNVKSSIDTLVNTNEKCRLIHVNTSDTHNIVSFEETVHNSTKCGQSDNTLGTRAIKGDALKSDAIKQSGGKVVKTEKKERDPIRVLDLGQNIIPSKAEETPVETTGADANDNIINPDMSNLDITVPFQHTSENCTRKSKRNLSNNCVNTESDVSLSSNTSEKVSDIDKDLRSNQKCMQQKVVKNKKSLKLSVNSDIISPSIEFKYENMNITTPTIGFNTPISNEHFVFEGPNNSSFKCKSELDDSKFFVFNESGKPLNRKAGKNTKINNSIESIKPAPRCTRGSAGVLDGKVAAKICTPDIDDITRTTKRQNACMLSSFDTATEDHIQNTKNDFKSTPLLKKKRDLNRRNPIKRECGIQSRQKVISSDESHDVLKCGVCLKNVEKCEWLPHCAKEHNYMGWIDGETPLNFADNKSVILHLQTILQSTSELMCTVCAKIFTSARMFWNHIRQCTEENNMPPFTEINDTTASLDALADENIEDIRPDLQISKVICAICDWEGKEDSWLDHTFKEHEYLSWRKGDPTLDFENKVVLQEHLRTILKSLSKLTCHKCGIDRKYVNNYIKHVKTCCGAVQESISPAKPQLQENQNFSLKEREQREPKLDLNSSDNKRKQREHNVNSYSSQKKRNQREPEVCITSSPKEIKQREPGVNTTTSPKERKQREPTVDSNSTPKERKQREPKVNSYFSQKKRKQQEPEALTTSTPKERKQQEPEVNTTTSPKERKQREPTEDSNSTPKERKQREPKVNSYFSQKKRKQQEPGAFTTSTPKERKQQEPEVNITTSPKERKQTEPMVDSNSTPKERKQREPKVNSYFSQKKRKQQEPDAYTTSTPKERKQQEPEVNATTSPKERKQREPMVDSNPTLKERKQQEPEVNTTSTPKERKQREPKVNSNSTPKEREQQEPKVNSNFPQKQRKRRRVSSESDNISLKKLKEESEAKVKCARCQETVGSNKWNEHLFKHDYVAWKDGEIPVDLEDSTSVNRQLRKALDLCKVFTCRLCDAQLTSISGYHCHIRRCEEKKLNLSTGNNSKRSGRRSNVVLPTSQQPTTDPVKCAGCAEEMPKEKWFSHLQAVHYNLAWFEGGTPLDIMDYNTCYIILNDLCKKLNKLECVKCGLTRISGAGFYAHIIVCQKSTEEIDAMKEPCEVCGRRYLPLYHSTHMSQHRRGLFDTAEDVAPAPSPSPADPSPPAAPGTTRRRAALAAKAIIEKISTELVESKKSCTGCGFEADTTEEIDKHCCGAGSIQPAALSDDDSEPEIRWESESESEESESAVESELSAEEESRSPSALSSEAERSDDKPARTDDAPRDNRKSKDYKRAPYKPGQDNHFYNKGFYAEYLKKLCDTHLTTETLFPEMCCQEFVPVSPEEVARYMPPLQRSCSMAMQKSQSEAITQWKSLDVFRSDYFYGVHRLFAGGPVTGVAWAPPAERGSRAAGARHLAAACQRDPDMAGFAAHALHSHPALIQIWCFDNFDKCTAARFVLGIAHEYGTVWALEWCPSGGREERAGRPHRLGLLAAACSDGSVYIFAVCHPDRLPPSENPIYKTKPAMELRLSSEGSSRQNYQATALHWSMKKGHSLVSVGYADGTIALYNISTDSPFLRKTQPGHVTVLNPYYDSQMASCTINALSVVPAGAAGAAGAGDEVEAAADAWSVWAAVQAEGAGAGAAVLSAQRLGLNGVLCPPAHLAQQLPTDDPIHLYTDGTEFEEWAALAQRQLVGAPAAACPHSRRLLHASTTGQIMLWRYLHSVQRIKKHILVTFDMIPLQIKKFAKTKANDNLEAKLEPFTYKEAVENYGIVCSTKNKLKLEGAPADCYPLSSVTCLALCPSARDFGRVACAGPAGLVHVCRL